MESQRGVSGVVWRVVRRLLQLGLALVALSIVAIVATLFVVRTDYGKRQILAFALPRIQKVLGGRLEVGRIEGDLFSTIIIHDAALAAADGRPAIRARRLEGHFSLRHLLFGQPRIEDLRGEGVWFGMHLMPDGRFNLAGLVAPSPPGTPPSDPNARHTLFVIAHAHLETELRYDAPTMPAALRVLEASVLVDGSLEIEGSTVRVILDHVDGALLPPLAAPAHAHGRLVIAGGSLTLDGVGAALDLDEPALHRLLPDELLGPVAPLLDRLGPARLEIATDGGVSPIALRVHAGFPGAGGNLATLATLDGVVTLAAEGPSWTATAETRGARFASKGQLDWQWLGPLEVSVDASDFSRLARFGLPKIGGHLRASAKLDRSLSKSDLTLDAHGEKLHFSSLRVDRAGLHAKITGGIGVAQATAHGVHAGAILVDQLALGARDDGHALAVTLDARGPRKSHLVLAVRGAPILKVGARAGAAFDHALVDGKLQIAGQTWRTTQPARVRLGGTIHVEGLALASGASRVTASGTYETTRGADGRIFGHLQGDRLDLRQLLSLVAPGVGTALPKSELSVALDARGTVQAPVVDAAIRATTIADPTRAFPATSVTVAAHYAAGHVRGEGSASLAGQRITASFTLPASAAHNGAIAGRALFDVDVARLPASLTLHLPVRAGRVHGSLSLGGTLGTPLLAARAEGRGLAGAHFDHVDMDLTASSDPSTAKAEARVTLRGMPVLVLRGRAALAGVAAPGTSLFDHWREIPVEIAGELGSYPLALVPEIADRIGGVIDGSLTLSGSYARPIGSASIHTVGLVLGKIPFGRFQADARFDGQAAWVKIDAAARTGTFVVGAKLPLSATAPWHIDAHLAEFPLDLAALPFSGLRSMKGTLNAQLTVDGTRARPLMSGFARARDGALALGDSSFLYDKGALDIGIEGDGAGQRVTLGTLSFSAAGGTFDATGTGRLDGLSPVALDVLASFHGYPVALKGVNGWLTTDVDLHLARGAAGVGGKVVLRDGRLRLADLSRVRSNQSTATPAGVHYVDAAGRRAVAAAVEAVKAAQAEQARRSRETARAATEDPNSPPGALLSISIPGPFHVDGKEVHVALKGDLHLDRLEADPRISGVIESTGGYVDLLGRRYELELLNIDFDGAPIPDPQLDVRITRATDVTVVVEVQGAASSPDVIFSSIPPVYSEEQVMAMIVSGSPSATDAGSESLDDRVAGALSGTFVGQLKDQLLPILPVDVIKVDLATNSLGQEDTRLEVGKYLTESVYVSYVHQLGTVFGIRRLNRNQLQLEYRFARHFEVETSFGDNGVGALDLYWDHRF